MLLNFIFWYQERISSDSDNFDKQGSKLKWRAEVNYLYWYSIYNKRYVSINKLLIITED